MVTAHTITKRKFLWVKFKPNWIKEKGNKLRTRNLHKEVILTLTFDLKHWFKITAYPLPKDTPRVKLEPD